MRFLLALLLLTASSVGAQDAQSPDAPRGVLTRAPELKSQVEAAYPPEALAQKLSATVELEIDLSETGQVTDARVKVPAGHGFDEAALAAVRQFQFQPAEVDGQATPVRITYAYHFLWRAPPPPEPSAPRMPGPVNFSGLVLERGTRRVLVGAEVVIEALGLSTPTDEQGRFSFRDLPAGSYPVKIVQTGYERYETEERIVAGQETQATYYVRKRYFSALETVVRSVRERKEVSQVTLQAAEVQRIPGTQGDALKVVQNLPGMARAAFNGGQLIIRGTSPNDSGVYLDGLRIPLLYHFGGLNSVYNSELLESVDYLPGSFSSYYGNVLGGVVDVKSRAPRTDGFHAVAQINLIESNLVLEGPLTKTLSVAVAARRSYIDGVLAALPEELSSDFSVAPVYYDAQAKVEWRPNARNRVSLLGLVSNDRLGLVFERPSDEDPSVQGDVNLRTGFNQLRLRHRYENGAFKLDSQALIGNTYFELGIGAARELNINSLDTVLRSTAEYTFSERWGVAGGVDINSNRARIDAEIDAPPQEGVPVAPGAIQEILVQHGSFHLFFPAVWAELRLKPLPGLLLIPGLRAEQYTFSAQKDPDRELNPRLAARYAVNDRWTLKGGAGVYHSAPSQAEPSVGFGNPELRAKRALQYSVGTEVRPQPALFVSVEGFYNDLRRLIVPSFSLVERGGAAVPERYNNAGIGRSYGVEVLVRRALTERFFGWVSYTLSRSERKDGPTQNWRRFDSDQTHVLTAIGSFRLPRGWELGARFRFATGNPYTPVVSAVRDDWADVFVPAYGRVNSRRLEPFHQLDVRVDKTWVFERWTLNAYLDLTNAYNNPSVEGVTYNYNYTEQKTFSGLPLLPVLGIKGNY